MAVLTSAMLRILTGQIARHHVHVIGQILPRASHATHIRLATQLPAYLVVHGPRRNSVTELNGVRIDQDVIFTDADFTPAEVLH